LSFWAFTGATIITCFMPCYVIAIATAAFGWPLIACALYIIVAIMWLVPDRRIERVPADRAAG
jgi:uncharacterized membrane protein